MHWKLWKIKKNLYRETERSITNWKSSHTFPIGSRFDVPWDLKHGNFSKFIRKLNDFTRNSCNIYVRYTRSKQSRSTLRESSLPQRFRIIIATDISMGAKYLEIELRGEHVEPEGLHALSPLWFCSRSPRTRSFSISCENKHMYDGDLTIISQVYLSENKELDRSIN